MVELEDRPGTLADLGEAAGAAGVNLDGIAAFTASGAALMHVLVVDIEDRPGRSARSLFESGLRGVRRLGVDHLNPQTHEPEFE